MINTDEISKLIEEKIKNFSNTIIENNNSGTVVFVADNIVLIHGLNKAMINELLFFPHDIKGIVMSLNNDYVSAALFDDDYLIKEGDVVNRSGEVVKVPVGNELLGRVINALGEPIDNNGFINFCKKRPIENDAPNIIKRGVINSPLETGIKIIDAVIPIGKGQRELIIGDPQIGKTAIAIDMIINQKNKNVNCIYTAIGQKNSSIINIYEKLGKFDALKYTTIVNAPSNETAAMQYIAPYSAMAIAEEWLSQGKDVLIIFDDLSKHAIAYRTLSLLLKQPSGREAYPGDIFYLHSRLLERACKLDEKNNHGSITAIPIVETQNSDITSYIPTNIISITDGQIFLVTDYFNAGIMPAIDINKSVSRIGSNAQYPMIKKIVKSLKTEIANYYELLSFSHINLNDELNSESQKRIIHGSIIMKMFRQNQYSLFSCFEQFINLYVVNNNFLDNISDLEKIPILLEKIYFFIKNNYSEIIEFLDKNKDFNDEIEEKLKTIIKNFLLNENILK